MSFGFIVRKHKEWEGPWQTGKQVVTDKWEVCLPHMCDEWQIAGGSGDSVSYEDAIKGLERFIGEAQEALIVLKSKREQNDE